MGDAGCQLIRKGVVLSNQLRVLNLSRNQITDNGTQWVSEMIEGSAKLEVLLLHWNQIRGKGSL